MIRVVLFDLGLTLIDAAKRPFPHVPEALTTIGAFTTAGGKKLETALVSDYDMPAPPVTPAKVEKIFRQYLAELTATGLRSFFEPVERHVTLSTHAGARKPAHAIFETALRRLRTTAALADCLFITEDGSHVRAAREDLGMTALQFGGSAAGAFDFDDWLQAPAMIAHLLGAAGGANLEAALRSHLNRAHGFDLQEVETRRATRAVGVRGTLWTPLGAAAGDDLADVHAPFPVEGQVTLGAGGEVRDVRLAPPAADAVKEAASMVRSLASHGQLHLPGTPASGATTHDIETDDRGRRKLVRKRFRAV